MLCGCMPAAKPAFVSYRSVRVSVQRPSAIRYHQAFRSPSFCRRVPPARVPPRCRPGLPGRGAELLAEVAKEAGAAVLRVLVGCQSLVMVDGDLVGDPLELAAFAATGAPCAPCAWSFAPHLSRSQQRLT